MTGFNELSHDTPRAKSRWRTLDPPVRVRAYVASQWHDLLAVDIDDDTRELRVEMPRVNDVNGVDLISHRVLDPSLYEAPAGTL
ncbi:MAG: hypothetical protein ACREN2_03125 [Candidatus Dormibacteria bacterium]